MLKGSGDCLAYVLLDIYNQVASGHMKPPESWKQSIITVLYKSGDASQPQIYRPITVIPLLYKLFARLVYQRLAPILNREQSRDQAGFRPGYSTDDHMITFNLMCEKADEYQLTQWIAVLDFKKAFDSIDHSKLWEALTEQGTPCYLTALLKRLYSGQQGRVKTDRLSKWFDIQRGTKQGDPLSSLLFNALLEYVMRPIKDKWASKRYGVQLGHTGDMRITNLRFADDVMLVARTLPQLQQMLHDMKIASSSCGLSLHPDKIKILSNATRRTGRTRQNHVDVDGLHIEILTLNATTKYLGRKICFENNHDVELQNRLRAAWAKFSTNKQELTSRHYSLNDRLRLFEAVVTPTFLYGSGTWTLTQQMESKVRRVQRRMLRMMAGCPRRLTTTNTEANVAQTAINLNIEGHSTEIPMNHEESGSDVSSSPNDAGDEPPAESENGESELEPWVEFIKRTTRSIELKLKRLGTDDWVSQARRRKWQLAQRILTDSSWKWSSVALKWNPETMFDGMRSQAQRRAARPKTRWTDEFVKVANRFY